MNLRPPGYETRRTRRHRARSACLGHLGRSLITAGQLRWVQNGCKVRSLPTVVTPGQTGIRKPKSQAISRVADPCPWRRDCAYSSSLPTTPQFRAARPAGIGRPAVVKARKALVPSIRLGRPRARDNDSTAPCLARARSRIRAACCLARFSPTQLVRRSRYQCSSGRRSSSIGFGAWKCDGPTFVTVQPGNASSISLRSTPRINGLCASATPA